MDLSSEQIQAITSGTPVSIVVDGAKCVILREDVYDRVKQIVEYDSGDWTDEEMRTVMAQTMGDDWSDPRMDVYDDPK